MKKLLSLLLTVTLVFTLAFTLVSCSKDDSSNDDGGNDNAGVNNTPKDIYELFESKKPTRTVTHVVYKIGEDKLEGIYDMKTEGKNSIFTFQYDKYRTSSEAIEDNDSSKIKTVEGAVYCKDGKYSGDGVVWGSSPVATDITLTLKKDLFDASVVSTDGLTLTAVVSTEKSAQVFGTALEANSDGITLILKSNGTYVTNLSISYVTATGAIVTIDTSYSYNAISLEFPG